MAATSRKIVDAHRIRRRLPEKYHIAIISTGLSYLAYLGALRKVKGGYKPSRFGKKIGKLLAKELLEEASVAWSELLKRHRLYRVFKKYFATHSEELWSLEDFGLYLKRRTHAKWDVSSIRSRISRICELFAEKGLIEYQNGHLSPINQEEKELEISSVSSNINKLQIAMPTSRSAQEELTQVSVSTNSWPVKMEIKIQISDRIDPKLLEMILSFLKNMKTSSEVSLYDRN